MYRVSSPFERGNKGLQARPLYSLGQRPKYNAISINIALKVQHNMMLCCAFSAKLFILLSPKVGVRISRGFYSNFSPASGAVMVPYVV